jgi:hypothetical protein
MCARPARKSLRVLCLEPPAERFEVDWGHLGVLDYTGDKRKLYAFNENPARGVLPVNTF